MKIIIDLEDDAVVVKTRETGTFGNDASDHEVASISLDDGTRATANGEQLINAGAAFESVGSGGSPGREASSGSDLINSGPFSPE
jgi:hypothetical protein